MNSQTVQKNDSQLVSSLIKGNILAFNALYWKYSVRLYKFSLGYLKSEAESEELVQEVFTKVWEKRKDLKAELSFKSFLFTVAFNTIKKHFRTKALMNEYLKNENPENPTFAENTGVTYNSLKQYIDDLVNLLPERRKEIFIKSRMEGLTIKEIAEEMKISHKTVENQLTDALMFIRTRLNKEGIPALLFFALFIT